MTANGESVRPSFRNILDPENKVSQILRTKHVYILKEEVGTLPRFYYYFDEGDSRAEKTVSSGSGHAESSGGCA